MTFRSWASGHGTRGTCAWKQKEQLDDAEERKDVFCSFFLSDFFCVKHTPKDLLKLRKRARKLHRHHAYQFPCFLLAVLAVGRMHAWIHSCYCSSFYYFPEPTERRGASQEKYCFQSRVDNSVRVLTEA